MRYEKIAVQFKIKRQNLFWWCLMTKIICFVYFFIFLQQAIDI